MDFSEVFELEADMGMYYTTIVDYQDMFKLEAKHIHKFNLLDYNEE